MLNKGKYDDDEDAWYYADGSGKLYAGEFKTIKGKKYAFRNDGRMISGLKFIKVGNHDLVDVVADDDDNHSFEDEDAFLAEAYTYFEGNGYKCYYFGNGEDGAMRTGKTSLTFDGENTNFYFEKSGGKKGAGVTGEKDNDGSKYYTYTKLADAEAFMKSVKVNGGKADNALATVKDPAEKVKIGNNSEKKAEDLSEAYTIDLKNVVNHEYVLVNTSGKVIDSKGKNKDGSDYYYVTDTNGTITNIYVED